MNDVFSVWESSDLSRASSRIQGEPINAIEGLWGYLKKTALNNYLFGDTERLEDAIDRAFYELNRHPETALSLAYTIKNYGRPRGEYAQVVEFYAAGHVGGVDQALTGKGGRQRGPISYRNNWLHARHL